MPARRIDDILAAIPDTDWTPQRAGAGGQPFHPAVITLDHRTDRWRLSRASLARAGITDVSKFSAIDGAALSHATRRALIDPACDIDAPPCSSSHADATGGGLLSPVI